ncbi:hypothetical protein EU537_13105 [Candidatus Thorarchaeota archaeon]|nr:MAG: hypothetical protein EU537_13105 [Candidatus Thorarchaeota archaeon]
MIDRKRITVSLIMGAILGVLCIVGVGGRIDGGYLQNIVFLIGMWYNRVIMGLLIGFAGEFHIAGDEDASPWVNPFIRGLLFGILVSFAIFLSTEFRDMPSLFAGFAYGPIIDIVATKYSES